MEVLSDKLKEWITENVPYTSQVDEELLSAALRKFAAYEDTGLEPEQVKDMAENAETRLLAWFEANYGKSVGYLMDLLDAEKEGRLVVLPCKVGDTVWEIKHSYVDWPDVSKKFAHEKVFDLQDLEKFGKTVFLTREEAEAALKGGAEHE